MSKPKLTIGMATFDDFHGVYFTVQSIRRDLIKGGQLDPREVELVVIDNAPGSPSGQAVERIIKGRAGVGMAGAKYIPMTDPIGTSPSRDRIFREASGEYVLVLDSHVLLMPGALTALGDYIRSGTDDLIQGPLWYDTLDNSATHFANVWRGEMWGVWSSAWATPDGLIKFDVEQWDGGIAVAKSLDMGRQTLDCIPEMPYAGHQRKLRALGYHDLAAGEEPFEIPGQGLGLFCAKRESWLGFNPHARAFGGEEMYIHQKYRDHGRRAICLPQLGWIHRFGDVLGRTVKPPLTYFHKVRNYVLEFQEMGWDLAPVHRHFVAEGKMNEPEWEYLVADPVSRDAGLGKQKCGGCGSKKPEGNGNPAGGIRKAEPDPTLPSVIDFTGHEHVLEVVKLTPRELGPFIEEIAKLTDGLGTVVEIGRQWESTAALACGRPGKVVSYGNERNETLARAIGTVRSTTKVIRRSVNPDDVDAVEECDLLLLHREGTVEELRQLIEKHAGRSTRYIALAGTNRQGMREAMPFFLVANRRWTVLSHNNDGIGFTLLGCRDEDKPKLPSKITMAKNFALALVGYVGDGLKKSSPELLRQRLEICTVCPMRATDENDNDRCAKCGCHIQEKAAMAGQLCPLGKWPVKEFKEVKEAG